MSRPSDPLPGASPRRVLVAGVSGSGKSTLARTIAGRLDLPYVELDALFHGPDWQPRPQFLADVEQFTGTDGWVTEWQYPTARPVLAARAELMVWLDLPTHITMSRLVRRTVCRAIRREELWNTNREPALRTFFTDPDHVVRWGYRHRNELRELVPPLASRFPQLRIVRLRSSQDVRAYLAELGGSRITTQ